MREIKIKLSLKGYGCVNNDSFENQKGILSKLYGRKFDENTIVMKKNYYRDDDGEIYFKPMIDSNKLKYFIFGDALDSYSLTSEELGMQLMAQWNNLIRGWNLIANKKSNLYGCIKKGSLYIPCAELVNNAVPQMVIQTSNSYDLVEHKRANTSMFNVETIGEAVWETIDECVVDISNLQFISADEDNDRMAMNPDFVSSGRFQEKLKMTYGDIANPITGFFKNGNKIEYGILLNQELIIHLIKKMLSSILNIHSGNRNGYVETSSLEIKIVDDFVENANGNGNEWIKIKSEDDINNINFGEVDNFHELVDKSIIELYNENKERAISEINSIKLEKESDKKTKTKKNKSDLETALEGA